MKKGKLLKLLSLLMVTVMSVSLLTACSGGSKGNTNTEPTAAPANNGTNNQEGTATETPAATEGADTSEFVKLVMYTYESGGNRGDEAKVMEEVNKILKDKLNCELELIALPHDQYETTVQMAINSGEEFDICFTSNWTMPYASNAAKGAFVDITDMLPKLAPGLWASMKEGIWDAARINGRIYAVINQQLFARISGYALNGKYYDEYNGDSVVDFKTFTDYTLRVKEGEEAKGNKMINMCYATDWLSAGYMQAVGWERLNSSNTPGTADIGQEKPVVFNEYDTDIFREMIQLKAEQQTAGVIDADILTTASFDRSKIIGEYGNTGLTNDEEQAKSYGWDSAVVKKDGNAFMNTSGTIATLNAISATSKNPERALMFLELLNTDSTLYNLLAFGIEGVHYKLVDGNAFEVIEGSQYSGTNWALGCVFNGLRSAQQPSDIWDVTKKANEEAKVSSLMGYTYDGTKVQSEIAMCSAIVSERMPLFAAGLYGDNTMAEYDKFMQELKDAGVDEIITDMQASVDAFLASK